MVLPRGLGLLFLLCAVAFGGCALPIQLSADYLVLDGYDEDADFRAVTGDDARVWIREFTEENDGNLEFWAQALEFDLLQQRGYQLVGKGEVADADGSPGRWLECAANVRGERFGHLIAIWVTGRGLRKGCTVRVVEFTARAEVWKTRVEAMHAALRTVDG